MGFWISPMMEMPSPLWTHTQLLTVVVKTFSLVGFSCVAALCYFLSFNLQAESVSVSSVPSGYIAADSSKTLPFIFLILNKLSLLGLPQLGYHGCFSKRCRWSRGLLAFQLLSCFLRWNEIFAGIVPIGERLLRLSCLFQITSLNSFPLQMLYTLCQTCFVCKQVQLKRNSLTCQTGGLYPKWLIIATWFRLYSWKQEFCCKKRVFRVSSDRF